MEESSKIDVSKPRITANIHRIEDRYDYLVVFLYDKNRLVFKDVSPIYNVGFIADKIETVIDKHCGEVTDYDVWTSTQLIYTALLHEQRVSCELKDESETSETAEYITGPTTLAMLSDYYFEKDGKAHHCRNVPLWEQVAIYMLKKIRNGLNKVTNKIKGEM
ncbi:hypothetical protein JFU18_20665 [Bacillus sp. TH22]|uniref:hypothetical protein n=1 Tax=unclassified Bacillus (in: firmicutes) TaxID=185979 RepID=UPI001911664B|nr:MULTISPECIES: hypothetical protein [unclassified Bacillus (in: firmicutes)]MBK5450910.1 hypothetical protein [Bacillus sp. TH22]MBK5455348.1 hypothetical protein [Bacillus sp. TH23]